MGLEYCARVRWTTFICCLELDSRWLQLTITEWKQAAWTFCKTPIFVLHKKKAWNYSTLGHVHDRIFRMIPLRQLAGRGNRRGYPEECRTSERKLTEPQQQENWKHIVELNKIRARARGGSGKKFNIFLISRM